MRSRNHSGIEACSEHKKSGLMSGSHIANAMGAIHGRRDAVYESPRIARQEHKRHQA